MGISKFVICEALIAGTAQCMVVVLVYQMLVKLCIAGACPLTFEAGESLHAFACLAFAYLAFACLAITCLAIVTNSQFEQLSTSRWAAHSFTRHLCHRLGNHHSSLQILLAALHFVK